LQMFASPLQTIKLQEFEGFIEEFLKTEVIDEFVLGYPVQLNNSPGELVKYIDPFLKKMRKLYPYKPVHIVDERFTSRLAFQIILAGGVKKNDRRDKSLVDKISASIILQSFLDRRSNKK
jgi:putative holliday junction resolvase